MIIKNPLATSMRLGALTAENLPTAMPAPSGISGAQTDFALTVSTPISRPFFKDYSTGINIPNFVPMRPYDVPPPRDSVSNRAHDNVSFRRQYGITFAEFRSAGVYQSKSCTKAVTARAIELLAAHENLREYVDNMKRAAVVVTRNTQIKEFLEHADDVDALKVLLTADAAARNFGQEPFTQLVEKATRNRDLRARAGAHFRLHTQSSDHRDEFVMMSGVHAVRFMLSEEMLAEARRQTSQISDEDIHRYLLHQGGEEVLDQTEDAPLLAIRIRAMAESFAP